MSIRVRRPETVTLNISQGDWLVVKKHLTAGEQRRMFGRLLLPAKAGEQPLINPDMIGLTTVLEYLLDWSLQDADGKPIVVRDQSLDVVLAAVRNIDADAYVEVQRAIETHDSTMTLERSAEKNAQAGEIASSAISASAA